MSSREVLNLAIQFARSGQLEGAAQLVAPHFVRDWRNSLSFDELASLVGDSTTPSSLRVFLIDFLIHEAGLNSVEKQRLAQVLVQVAESAETQAGLRRYALLALRDETAKDQAARIRRLAETPGIDPEVRGAAITALRRTGDESHDAVVASVLDSPAAADPQILRHAVVSAAKAGAAANQVGTLRNIAVSTENAEVYASTIYALGLVGTEEAVVAIVDAFGRHGNEHIARHSLQRNEEVILEMLAPNQPSGVLISGIQASRVGALGAAKAPLSLLISQHSDPDIRSRANEALLALSVVPDIDAEPRRQ